MKRDEQLLHATTAYQAKLLEQGYNPVAADNYADGFYEGAVWADANTCWHKCEDELPELEKKVICYTKNKIIVSRRIKIVNQRGYERETWAYSNPNAIIAWTELPQPPKFD